NHLPEPAAVLRRVQPVRIGGRSLEVVNLPAREVWPAHVPLLARAVRRQDERALPGADENSNTAHLWLRLNIERSITQPLDIFQYRNNIAVMARAATTSDAFNAVAEPRRRDIL